MLYAVLQTDLSPPPVDLLRRAFRSVPFLTDLDAHTLSQDGYGILIRRLSQENAASLQLALRNQGLETELVPEQKLPGLPAGKQVHRVDVTPQALHIYDPAGRSFPLEWGHLAMIAAGKVRLNEFRTVESRRRRWATREGEPDWVTETRTREERTERLVLELILSGAVLRYSLVGDHFNYAYLGERLRRTADENFALLVQDLIARAPHATINRGAYYLRENAAETFAYPSRNAFTEEIIWLLWKGAGAQTGSGA